MTTHQELVSNPMADNSLDNLHNKDSPVSGPTADIISDRLHELKIAYIVMQRHPEVLNEFVCAVKGGLQTHQKRYKLLHDRFGSWVHSYKRK
jgi:hypothetical protein